MPSSSSVLSSLSLLPKVINLATSNDFSTSLYNVELEILLTNVPGSSFATNFPTLSVVERLIPRPEIHCLVRVLIRGKILELPYLGRDGRKISRGGQKLVAAWSKNKSRRSKN